MLQFLIHVRQYLPAFMELMHLPINIDQGDDQSDGQYTDAYQRPLQSSALDKILFLIRQYNRREFFSLFRACGVGYYKTERLPWSSSDSDWHGILPHSVLKIYRASSCKARFSLSGHT